MTKMNGNSVYGQMSRLLAAAQKELPPLLAARGLTGAPLVETLKSAVDRARQSGKEVKEASLPNCPLGIMSEASKAVDNLLARPGELRHAVGKRAGRDILVALRDVKPQLENLNTMIVIEMTTIR